MKRNVKHGKYMWILLLVLFATVGYAYISTTLKINGTVGVNKHSWEVYWDNAAVDQNCSTPEEVPYITENTGEPSNTRVIWNTTFTYPGDYYEFTVDAVNNGDIDAMITTFNTQVTPTLPNYIKYEIKYDDGTTPEVYDKLAKKSGNDPTVKRYRIKVWYDETLATGETINAMNDDVTYNFDLGIVYGIADENAASPIERRMNAILANPNDYRNPNQPVSNKDIGLDEDGNVINLDDWVSSYWDGTPDKFYGRVAIEKNNVTTYYDEIELGDCSGSTTIATASERIINGKMTTPIPAYILLEGENQFYPVTLLTCIWGDVSGHGRTHITELPDMPETVVELGPGLFWELGEFEYVEIPKRIKYIDFAAFSGAFKQNGTNNAVTFENGSKLERIGESAFADNKLKGTLTLPSKVTTVYGGAFENNNYTSISLPNSLTTIPNSAFENNNLSGNLVLSQNITSIGKNAFLGNNLTSVTFPNTATYFTNCIDSHSNVCDSFDQGVTINHQY